MSRKLIECTTNRGSPTHSSSSSYTMSFENVGNHNSYLILFAVNLKSAFVFRLYQSCKFFNHDVFLWPKLHLPTIFPFMIFCRNLYFCFLIKLPKYSFTWCFYLFVRVSQYWGLFLSMKVSGFFCSTSFQSIQLVACHCCSKFRLQHHTTRQKTYRIEGQTLNLWHNTRGTLLKASLLVCRHPRYLVGC